MAIELILVPEIESDLGEAFTWYEQRRQGLGLEFLTCVDACLQSICRNPQVYARVADKTRRALVRRFPYAVFFEEGDGRITVYAICHTAQHPSRWKLRVP
jgi:plasmid stabilization system protein ParE